MTPMKAAHVDVVPDAKYTHLLEEIPKYVHLDRNVDDKHATLATHGGHDATEHDSIGHPVIAPILLSTTFVQAEPNKPLKYDYSRGGNHTRNALEACLAGLEGAKHGLTFASGLAALTTVTQLLKSGDNIMFFYDVYGGSNRYFRKVLSKFNVTSTPVDFRNLANVEKHLTAATKLVWIETPSNPTMRVVDIAGVSAIVKKYDPTIMVAVDNTFLSPIFQNPLKLGADIVVHSITKYINGHSDILMGCIVCNDDKLESQLRFLQYAVGAVPAPLDCYLVLRSIRTLHVRMHQHQYNGLAVALFLQQHPAIEKVLHPSLPSHPQFELSQRQTKGSSGMVCLYLKGAIGVASTFIKRLKVFSLAESLGGFESLAEIPSLMTHASVPENERKELEITDNMVRLSVGLENVYDLLRDLDQALEGLH